MVEFDASILEGFADEATAVAHVGSFATTHQADHSVGFAGLEEGFNAEEEVGSDEEGGQIDGFGVFAEDGRVLDASNFVAHVHIFETGGGDGVDEVLSAEVFPIAA